ncbi:Sua5/YciO/YrdC family protein [Scardovia inopinata]|nr:Sua5/YciO/YrdC family protein [Scardovia inopinata]
MTSKILPLYDGDSLEKTVQTVTEAIRSGKTAVIPTDTVYGLVADPLSVSAVQGIFRAKHRPPEKTVQILCSNPDQARKLGLIIPHIYEQLLDIFPPGSLCLVCSVISTCPLVTTRTVSGGDGDVNASATAVTSGAESQGSHHLPGCQACHAGCRASIDIPITPAHSSGGNQRTGRNHRANQT